MAHDEARAQRIRDLKQRFPDVRWSDIADHVGVRERSAIDWQRTGGISRANVKKLADFFRSAGADDITAEWIWHGDEQVPDLIGAFNGNGTDRIGRLEALVVELSAKVDELLELMRDR